MLTAITTSTLHDDVFREDPTTLSFESHIATLCGHEDGAFVISGTMANQLALRTLLAQPPYAILADTRAHIIHFEGGSVSMSGAAVQHVRPSNGRFMRLEDIMKKAVISEDVHKCPTQVISIENTAGGSIVPLDEMKRISEWARQHGIKVHLDGARLWEAVAAGAGSLKDYCTLCDLVCLDFSKNLGAPMGAMVLGSEKVIAQLRRVRKSIGGAMRQCGPLVAAARVAVDEQFGSGVWGSRDTLRRVHDVARRVGEMWIERGGRLLRGVETNQIWVDLEGAGIDARVWNEAGRRHGIKLDGKRIVLHHQISEEAVSKLRDVFCEVLQVKARL
ncbi:Alanine racemase TOXG [Penicillium subrubescens]|uniref:Alanine racemase TOXG n=2 Tax=Penicillium subrubescens TaxID=1316194 RepID=A0A1Q5SRJ0_9EURO|nr:Alanine racemase TOXG [Penicillium subrubescens]